MQRHPDRDLIELARNGSGEAAGALFDRYWLFAWRAAYAVTMNRTLADDAAQEAIDAGAPTRLDRARVVAEGLRQRLPQVPIGLLSLTDRVLPHLFPTTDGTVFVATLEQAIGIERPPPALFFSTRATSLNALESIPLRDFFAKTARKRLLVVPTDGESQDVTADPAARTRADPRSRRISCTSGTRRRRSTRRVSRSAGTSPIARASARS